MLYNKNKYLKANDKKVLHKKGKQWITISVALLAMLGAGATVTHTVTHASQTVAASKPARTKSTNESAQAAADNAQDQAQKMHSVLVGNQLAKGASAKQATPTKNAPASPKDTSTNTVSKTVKQLADITPKSTSSKVQQATPQKDDAYITVTPKSSTTPNTKSNNDSTKNKATQNPNKTDQSNQTKTTGTKSSIVTTGKPVTTPVATRPKRHPLMLFGVTPDHIISGTLNGLTYKYDTTKQTIEFTSGTYSDKSTGNSSTGKTPQDIIDHPEFGGTFAYNFTSSTDPSANNHIKSVTFDSGVTLDLISDGNPTLSDGDNTIVMFNNDSALKTVKFGSGVLPSGYTSNSKINELALVPNAQILTSNGGGVYTISQKPATQITVTFSDVYKATDGKPSPGTQTYSSTSDDYTVTMPNNWARVYWSRRKGKFLKYGNSNQTVNLTKQPTKPINVAWLYKPTVTIKDVYSSSDGKPDSVKTYEGINNGTSYTVKAPDGYKFVDNTAEHNILNTQKYSYKYTDGDKILYVAPVYDGMTYKYNKTNKSIEFTGGTFKPTDPGNFLGYAYNLGGRSTPSGSAMVNPSITNVKFDNTVRLAPDVHTFDHMFYGDSALQRVTLPSNWTYSQITNMNGMFQSDNALTDINLPSSFDTSNVSDMSHMFQSDSNLDTIHVGTTNTNPGMSDLSKFNVSKVTNMSSMFQSDKVLPALDLSDWTASNVTDMSNMFQSDASDFHHMSGTSNTEKTGLPSIKLPTDTSKVINMSSMFKDDDNLTSFPNLNQFKTSDVTDMSNMFQDVQAPTLDLSGFNTKKVKNMSGMFISANIQNPSDIKIGSNFDTSNVSDMSYMFYETGFTGDITMFNLNTTNVTNMHDMFGDESNPTTITLPNSFDTSHVTNMTNMFGNDTDGDRALQKLVLPSAFKINTGTSVTNMFNHDKNLRVVFASNINKIPAGTNIPDATVLNPKEVTFTINYTGTPTPQSKTVETVDFADDKSTGKPYIVLVQGNANSTTSDTVNVPAVSGYVSSDTDPNITFNNGNPVTITPKFNTSSLSTLSNLATTVHYTNATKNVTFTVHYTGAATNPSDSVETITLTKAQGSNWSVTSNGGSDAITPKAVTGYHPNVSTVTPAIDLTNPKSNYSDTVTFSENPAVTKNVQFTTHYVGNPNNPSDHVENITLSQDPVSGNWSVVTNGSFNIPTVTGYKPSVTVDTDAGTLSGNVLTPNATDLITVVKNGGSKISDTVTYTEQKGNITVNVYDPHGNLISSDSTTKSDLVGTPFDIQNYINQLSSKPGNIYDYQVQTNATSFTGTHQTAKITTTVDPSLSQGTLTIHFYLPSNPSQHLLSDVTKTYTYDQWGKSINSNVVPSLPMNYQVSPASSWSTHNYANGLTTTLNIPVNVATKINVEFVTPDNNGAINLGGKKYTEVPLPGLTNPYEAYSAFPYIVPFNPNSLSSVNSLLGKMYTLNSADHTFVKSIVGNTISGSDETIYSSVNPIQFTNTINFIYNGHLINSDLPNQSDTVMSLHSTNTTLNANTNNDVIYNLVNNTFKGLRTRTDTGEKSYVFTTPSGTYLLPYSKTAGVSDQFNSGFAPDHTVVDAEATANEQLATPTFNNQNQYTQNIYVEKLGKVKVQLINFLNGQVLPLATPKHSDVPTLAFQPSSDHSVPNVLSDVGIVGTSTSLKQGVDADVDSNLTPYTPSGYITSDVSYNKSDLDFQKHEYNDAPIMFSTHDRENGLPQTSTFVFLDDSMHPQIAQFGVAPEAYFAKTIDVKYYNIDTHQIDHNFNEMGIYGTPFDLSPYYVTNNDNPALSKMPVYDKYAGTTWFYYGNNLYSKDPAYNRSINNDRRDASTVSLTDADNKIKSFDNNDHTIYILVKPKNPEAPHKHTTIFADYHLYDQSKLSDIGDFIMHAGSTQDLEGQPFSSSIYYGSLPALYYIYPGTGSLTVRNDVSQYGSSNQTIDILLMKRKSTITINYVDKNGHVLNTTSLTKPVIANLDPDNPQPTPFTEADYMSGIPTGCHFVKLENTVTQFAPADQTLNVEVSGTPVTPPKSPVTPPAPQAPVAPSAPVAPKPVTPAPTPQPKPSTPVESGPTTNLGDPIHYGKKQDTVTYKGHEYPVHYNSDGKNIARVKVLVKRHGKPVMKHGKPVYRYKNIVVSTNLPVPGTSSSDTVRAVDRINFNKVTKHAFTAKGLNKALNTLDAGKVVSYHGHKFVRVNVPGHFRYFWVVKGTLAHIYMSNVGSNRKFMKALKSHHMLTIYIKGIFVQHSKHANHVRYEVSFNHHNYWVTARDDFTQNAYWQTSDFKAKHSMKIRVTHDCMLYHSYKYNKHTVIKPVHTGAVFHVKKVIFLGKKSNYQTRLVLSDGRYITANKNFVKIAK